MKPLLRQQVFRGEVQVDRLEVVGELCLGDVEVAAHRSQDEFAVGLVGHGLEEMLLARPEKVHELGNRLYAGRGDLLHGRRIYGALADLGLEPGRLLCIGLPAPGRSRSVLAFTDSSIIVGAGPP